VKGKAEVTHNAMKVNVSNVFTNLHTVAMLASSDMSDEQLPCPTSCAAKTKAVSHRQAKIKVRGAK
jgi:hypothetical protein